MRFSEPAPAKLNLALHVRGKLPDGRHALETIFAFCVDGDRVEAEPGDEFGLEIVGPFAGQLTDGGDNLVLLAAKKLAGAADVVNGVSLRLTKNLPVASGIGGGSADAAATLRLLTRLWSIDPAIAESIAPALGSDVPACLLSLSAKGEGAGDRLQLVDLGVASAPVLLVNPGVPLSTRDVFSGWDDADRGPLSGWRDGRNDLVEPARKLVPEIGDVLDWLKTRRGGNFVRMSGSGATCFALFDDEQSRDDAAAACPPNWWHLASFLR
jgi:4-diphosphocytidyl-2-C-methyl-D-erythritol kinase